MCLEIVFSGKLERSNRRKQLRKESMKKNQASTGFEPMTTAMPVLCPSPLERVLKVKAEHFSKKVCEAIGGRSL